ncbi:hypothetical protein [Tenacibaculum singaporense]|uniref:hypothetical protein n=1 Tax=Tenacibaculum singaporense TaxID=2358479 RepID=UPI000F66DE58|nr:hypothetical protein [Tenacibaculum singaporense]RSC92951.1 hypothetical protein EI424_10925 [Tenacibaculum singaporense]GFD83572.1 hypothetical protein KUL118_64340 [Tenacibaculum sp. KUL118]
MMYIKRKWFILCIYNFYIGIFLYPSLAYNNIFKINKDSVVLHTFPLMIIGLISYVYIFEYFKNDEYRVNKTQFAKILILIIKAYIIISMIITPFLMYDFLIWSIIFCLLGIGSVFYLFYYFRTDRDIL